MKFSPIGLAVLLVWLVLLFVLPGEWAATLFLLTAFSGVGVLVVVNKGLGPSDWFWWYISKPVAWWLLLWAK